MSTLTLIDVRTLKSSVDELPVSLLDAASHDEPIVRAAQAADIEAIDALVAEHATEGHLLPRSRNDIVRYLHRFVVAQDDDRIVGCADLAPLSRRVAEVRSLVVEREARSRGIGRLLVEELERQALASGFETLTAFTHSPRYFVRMGFSIVPHVWVPEKIEVDCRSCALFRQCGQYAVMLPLVRTPTLRVPLHSRDA